MTTYEIWERYDELLDIALLETTPYWVCDSSDKIEEHKRNGVIRDGWRLYCRFDTDDPKHARYHYLEVTSPCVEMVPPPEKSVPGLPWFD